MLELRSLLIARQYATLEHRLGAIQAENERDPVRELEAFVAFSTFAASDGQLKAPLAEWSQTRHASYAAHAARGVYYARQGWLSRGSLYSHRTPPRQFRQMEAHFEVARGELKQAQSLNPRLMIVHTELIDIARALGDREAMDAQLAAAVAANPLTLGARSAYLDGLQPKWGGSIEEMSKFAHGAQAYGDRNQALTTLEGYVDSYVRGPEAFSRGAYQEALAHYDAALRHGETTLFLIPRAQTLNALGRYREAIADCTRVLEIRPHSLTALRSRAEALYGTGQLAAALEDVTMGLSFDPTDEGLLAYRAWMSTEAKRYDESLADYKRALEVQPNSGSLWAAKGQLLIVHLGRTEEGEADCRRALALDDENANAWFCQGLALAHRGSPDARKSFDRALELSKGSSLYTSLAYRLLQGQGLPIDTSEAVRLFEKAAEMGDRNAQAHLGFLYANGQGVPKDYQRAVRWLSAAAEAGEASAMGNLALIHAQGLGVPRDYEKTAHWLREAIRAGNVPARANYGVMFWYGHGKPRDVTMAYRWIKSAEQMGDAGAKGRLPELLAAMTPEQIKEGDRLIQQNAAP